MTQYRQRQAKSIKVYLVPTSRGEIAINVFFLI